MRIVNDHSEPDRKESEVNFFLVLIQALYCGMGFASVLLGPLSSISAQLRLIDPWSKLSILSGAVIAMTFFEIPMPMVLILFIMGLVVADSVSKSEDLWRVLGKSSIASLAVGFLMVLTYSKQQSMGLGAYWTGLIDSSLQQLQASVQFPDSAVWETLRSALVFESPFIMFSFAIISVWLSVGTAAHLSWFPKEHPLSSGNLRKFRLPIWASALFLVLFLSVLLKSTGVYFHWFTGLLRVVSAIMFIRGCISISEVLARHKIQPRIRTLIYSVSVTVGIYAVVGLGVMAPWLRKKEKV